jgi:hypothetical protein
MEAERAADEADGESRWGTRGCSPTNCSLSLLLLLVLFERRYAVTEACRCPRIRRCVFLPPPHTRQSSTKRRSASEAAEGHLG